MSHLDFVVLGVYGLAMVVLAVWIGRSQTSRADYYLAGRSMPAWQIAGSILATQISAVSLVGGPAFVAIKPGGGLIWLQYEFAIPLAMIAVAVLFLPAFHAAGVTTIYEYLERRFGIVARTSLSGAFMLTRGLATGIIIYTSAKVVAVPLGWDLGFTIAIVCGVSLAYTVVGGIRADILTDIIQLGLLWVATVVCIFFAGGFSLEGVDPARLRIFDASRTGLGDGGDFTLLPMLVGGFFLYVSYYACDQSQAQRLLTTPDAATARRAVLWNGLLRFPLALTYCAFGVVLAGYVARHPEFAALIKEPNDLVPVFLVEQVPSGIRGLFIAGVLAASMSTLDSNFNSLSAATMEDFLRRFSRRFREMEERAMMRWSRLLTFLWGGLHRVRVPPDVPAGDGHRDDQQGRLADVRSDPRHVRPRGSRARRHASRGRNGTHCRHRGQPVLLDARALDFLVLVERIRIRREFHHRGDLASRRREGGARGIGGGAPARGGPARRRVRGNPRGVLDY